MIELRAVTKRYRLGSEEVCALDNVNLSVKRGEFFAVMGASGSGKSTLANIIGGLDVPDSGSVRVAGQDLARADDRRLSAYRNRTVGFVFQSFNLQPNYTALENVTVPMLFARVAPSQRRAHAIECLSAVGLEARLNHRPGQLSGGERQRVCIARALANRPELIIADEPTGNLDSRRGDEIMALLGQLNSVDGITLMVITHDPAVARRAGRTLLMSDGRLQTPAVDGGHAACV